MTADPYAVIRIHEREFCGATFRFGETAHPASLDTFADEQEIRDAWWDIRPGDVVIDVGAGMGSYTLPALALGARVLAFSPQEPDRTLLLQNIRLNGFENYTLIPGGLHRHRGWVAPDGAVMRFHLGQVAGGFAVGPLDDIILGYALERLTWLKVDVEGLEQEVLHGAERTLAAYRPRLLVEYHTFMDPAIELGMRDFFRDLSYSWTLRPYHAVVHGLYLPRA